jgi:hypothetical protein
MASLVGIGAVLTTVDGRIKIVSLKSDGSAAASGNVRFDDVLVALNGTLVTSEARAKDLILGPLGTTLKAELSRSGQAVTVTLWRGGAEAQAKGQAAEKAKVEAEANAAADAKAAAEAKAAADAKAAAEAKAAVLAFPNRLTGKRVSLVIVADGGKLLSPKELRVQIERPLKLIKCQKCFFAHHRRRQALLPLGCVVAECKFNVLRVGECASCSPVRRSCASDLPLRLPICTWPACRGAGLRW